MRLSNASPEKKRVIVLDCDGTILNTEVLFLVAHHKFTREARLDDKEFLAKFDEALDPEKDGRFFYTQNLAGTGPDDKYKFYNMVFKPRVPFTYDEVKEIDMMANAWVMNHVCRDTLLPGRRDFLEECFKDENCSVYMLTSSLEEKVRKNLHDAGLEKYFGYEGEANVFSYGMYDNKAHAIDLIVKKENIAPDQLMYFEDSVKGVKCGSRADKLLDKAIKVVGCVDGSHCYRGYDKLLLANGATEISYGGENMLGKLRNFLHSEPKSLGEEKSISADLLFVLSPSNDEKGRSL